MLCGKFGRDVKRVFLWLPMLLAVGGSMVIYNDRILVGLFFSLIAILSACLSSFDSPLKAERREFTVFALFLFLSYAAFHEIIKHSLDVEMLRYLRDFLFFIVVILFFLERVGFFLFASRIKLLIFYILSLGMIGVLLSDDLVMALWAYRDAYMYAICAVLAMAVASKETLNKFSYLVVSIALVNLVVGTVQQLNGQEFWLSIGYGDIATSEWQGIQRPWGTFDRSLTYGHFLLLGSILAFFILRMPIIGTILLLGAYLSFNRSVLVSSLVVTLAILMSETYRSSRLVSLISVVIGGVLIFPLIESVLLSLFDPQFRSNSERLSDYISILSLGISELIKGGHMGLVGSNAGRFSLEASFTSGVAHIHSGYLTLVLELGFIGALAFLLIMFGLFMAAFEKASGNERICLALVFVMFSLSMFTHNMQSNIPNNIYLWVFLGLFTYLYQTKGGDRGELIRGMARKISTLWRALMAIR